MKCSLLTLSTFIDGELSADRVAEVDAHLVGCPRCSAGADTLREEKARVGRLARVQVDAASARLMLEQVGIALPMSGDLAPPAPPPPQQADWQGGHVVPASPWTDSPSAAPADAIEEVPVPADSFDAQPDLFDSAQPAAASGDEISIPGYAAAATRSGVVADEPGVPAGTPVDRLADSAPSASWETDLPPPVDDLSDAGRTWGAAFSSAAEPPPAEVGPPPLAPPPMVAPPTRAPAPSGPVALLGRVRDAVALRIALARRTEAADDSVRIVNSATRRGAAMPAAPGPPAREVIAATTATPPQTAAGAPASAGADTQPSIELSGVRRVALPSHPNRESRAGSPPADDHLAGHRSNAAVPPIVEAGVHPATPSEPEPWHAFAASSYPVMTDAEPAPQAQPRPLGRHSRAVARERVSAGARVAALFAAAATAMRARTAIAAGAARRVTGRLVASGPDSRIIAGVAGIGLIFVVALLIGHGSTAPRTPTATRPAPSAANPAPQHSAAVPPLTGPATAPASATTRPATVPSTQTFGSGATGFQVNGLRYGKQPTFMRVVFDIGAVGAAPAGTPRVTVSFSDPKTVLVTLVGAAPSASGGNLPSGTIISSVTLVSHTSGRSVYRFALTRAATVRAFFLQTPMRFVLDLH